MIDQDKLEVLKSKLTDEQYNICFNSATESPFSGDLLNNNKPGIYSCTVCGNELFGSSTKYKSGSGWPSFFEPINQNSISLNEDNSHGMTRTEVKCANCGAHLGHVFDDGPQDKTGKRFCINSIALEFSEKFFGN
jgi:peptide-methionine (R)-S-oxide reductase